jgi:hypothetical protein
VLHVATCRSAGIHYAGGVFLTGDRMADALIETVEDTRDGPTDHQLVRELTRRTALLHVPRAGQTRSGAGNVADGCNLPDDLFG